MSVYCDGSGCCTRSFVYLLDQEMLPKKIINILVSFVKNKRWPSHAVNVVKSNYLGLNFCFFLSQDL